MTITIPNPATRIIEEPPEGSLPMAGGVSNLVISVATAADTITPWGMNPTQRDTDLRAFWPTETYFASALFSTIAQYVAFSWSLDGPPRSVGIAQTVLNNANFGEGWEGVMTPFLVDYFTQDNGAFLELVRTDDDPGSPVVTFNHLDAHRCQRTGRREEPVIYVDDNGRRHKLKWYQVMMLTEMPSPITEARGIQYSALTRILRFAQTMRDIAIVKQEKAGGRFTRQVHLVSGVQTRQIETAMQQKQAASETAGFFKYVQPLIMGSLDPTARVSLETINLASVPDDWDEEKSTRAYILALSIAFGIDYQSIAPLPGGGLGSASESKVLNMKSRGKGPGLFMRKIERLFNFHGVLPRTVSFKFGEQDAAEQMERTEVRKGRALLREIMIRSGEITTEVARQMALDEGDIDEHYIQMMREANATDTITVESTEKIDPVPAGHVEPGMPGPKAPPGGAPARPPNSNAERPRSPATNQRRNPGGTPEGSDRA